MAGIELPQAIQNNVDWCTLIGESHGVTSESFARVWLSREAMPPLYPNLITLCRAPEIDSEIEQIESCLSSGWGVKDSFASLNLESTNTNTNTNTDNSNKFKLALEATWYARPAAVWVAGSDADNQQVISVGGAAELEQWENAWRGSNDLQRIFLPDLLLNPVVEFLYVKHDGRIEAGLAINRSGNVVGVTNAFGKIPGILACLRHVANRHVGEGLVGYGGAGEFALLQKAGFEALGDLRVWIRV